MNNQDFKICHSGPAVREICGAPSVDVLRGASDGLRDPRLLFQPHVDSYRKLVVQDAAFFGRLSQRHFFVDGNKRTTFATANVFLAINGLDITMTDDEAQDFI